MMIMTNDNDDDGDDDDDDIDDNNNNNDDEDDSYDDEDDDGDDDDHDIDDNNNNNDDGDDSYDDDDDDDDAVAVQDRVCRWDERTPGDHIYWFGDSGRHNMGFLGPYYVAKMSNDFTVVSSTADHKVSPVSCLSHFLSFRVVFLSFCLGSPTGWLGGNC